MPTCIPKWDFSVDSSIVSQRIRKATPPLTEVVADGDASGLTSTSVRPQVLLFGSDRLQALLLEIARTGEVRLERIVKGYHLRLVTVGICRVHSDGLSDVLTLDARHPAIVEICDVLSELIGSPVVAPDANGEAGFVHEKTPLGHRYETPFRIMLALAQAGCPLDLVTLQRRIPDRWPSGIEFHVEELMKDGVVVGGEGRYALSDRLPRTFSKLLLRLAELIDDPRLKPRLEEGPRTWAYGQAADAAPRLFGTDIRLRNLMALAVHGPMMRDDLRRTVGVAHGQREGADYAPFGRGDLVRSWKCPNGMALALDEAHPLQPPLRRLLVWLAEIYPLPPHVPKYGRPEPPPPQAWKGTASPFSARRCRPRS